MPAWAARCTTRSPRSAQRSTAAPNCCGRTWIARLLSLLDPQAGALLDQTGYTQPVMFAIEYALATLWRSWGIEPAAVMGHSVGEFAAACVAGVFSLEDGLRLIAERARLMQSLPPGGLMAAVFAPEARVAAALATVPRPGDDRRPERAGEHRHFRRRAGRPRGAGPVRRAKASSPRRWPPRTPSIRTAWTRSWTPLRQAAESVTCSRAEDRHHRQPDGPAGRRSRPTPIRAIGAATPARRCGSPRACRRWPTAAASCSWKSAPAPR